MAWFAGIDGLDRPFPTERTPEAVRAAIGEADIVVSDWSAPSAWTAAEVAARATGSRS